VVRKDGNPRPALNKGEKGGGGKVTYALNGRIASSEQNLRARKKEEKEGSSPERKAPKKKTPTADKRLESIYATYTGEGRASSISFEGRSLAVRLVGTSRPAGTSIGRRFKSKGGKKREEDLLGIGRASGSKKT